MGMKATVLWGTTLWHTGSVKSCKKCPPFCQVLTHIQHFVKPSLFLGKGESLRSTFFTQSLRQLCFQSKSSSRWPWIHGHPGQFSIVSFLHGVTKVTISADFHVCSGDIFYNFTFLVLSQICSWAPHMDHLILVEVIFSGEKPSGDRPGAVSRLPHYMVWGHSIKQALSEQRTSGFLCSHCFRARCPSSRKF